MPTVPRTQRKLPLPKEIWWILAAIYERTRDKKLSHDEVTDESTLDEARAIGAELTQFRLTEFLKKSGQRNPSLGHEVNSQLRLIISCIETGAKIPEESVTVVALLLVNA